MHIRKSIHWDLSRRKFIVELIFSLKFSEGRFCLSRVKLIRDMDSSSKKRRRSVVPVQRQDGRVGVWDDNGGVFTQANPLGPSQIVQTEGN